MEIYRTEEEQVAALKRWWNTNGKPVIAGVTVGFAGLLGWQGWTHRGVEQAEEASTLYQKMLVASREDRNAGTEQATTLVEQYTATIYASFAALQLAAVEAERGELEAAGERLRWVLKRTSQEQLLEVTRLRLARIYIAQERLDDAEALLTKYAEGGFAPLYAELSGDIHAARGDLSAAREAWQEALRGHEDGNALLSMKLENLGS